MKASEARVLSEDDLDQAIENARREQFNLRFQQVTGRLADPMRKRIVRRDLARLLTVRRERDLWAAYGELQDEEA